MSTTFSTARGKIDFSRGITILFVSGKFFEVPILVHFFSLGRFTKPGVRLLEQILLNWNKELNCAATKGFRELQRELVKLFLTHEDFGKLSCSPKVKWLATETSGIDANSIYSPEDPCANGIIFAYDDLKYLKEDLDSAKLNLIVFSFFGDDSAKKAVGFGIGQSYNSYYEWMKDLVDRKVPRFGHVFTEFDLRLDKATMQALLTGMYPEGMLPFKVSSMSFQEAAQFCKIILGNTASPKLNVALNFLHCMPQTLLPDAAVYTLSDGTLFVPNF